MKKRIVKITAFFFAVFLFCMSLVPIVGAEEFKNPMLDSYVCDDLNTYGFRLSDYSADMSSKRVSLMHFQEYGFHKDGDPRYYDLYVYVYNPSCQPIETTGNFIQLAFGESKNYKKYPLELLSHSVDDENENLFYKFKVSATEAFNNTANRGTRKYFISGIELNFRDDSRDNDYPVSQEWIYSGYQYNFGSSNPAGSLVCNVKELETIKIDLHGARWFSDDSDYGKDFRYEVSSVYFAIPNYIIREYGNPKDKKNGTSGLVSVQGSYNKYGINGLIVESQDAYNAFSPVLNKSRDGIIYELDHTEKYQGEERAFWENLVEHWPSFVGNQNLVAGSTAAYAPFGYNYKDAACSTHLGHVMLLLKGSSAEISENVLTSLWEGSGKPCHLTPDTLHIGSYTNGISKDLQYFDISVNDGDLSSSIKSYISTKETTFGKFMTKLFNWNLFTNKEVYPECKPLIEITNFNLKDLAFTEKSMCNDMYMSQEDLNKFDEFYDDNHLKNHIYIMRFGVDPYYCSDLDKGTNISQKTGERGWYYEKVIYDNFDVLSFTFEREDGFISVVPVNCKPISIIGSVVPGSNSGGYNPNGDYYTFKDFLKDLWAFLQKLKIFPILMGILVFVIFFKVIWPIFKKVGNAVLEVAKARASRPKNENRDKSPPAGDFKGQVSPAKESNQKMKKKNKKRYEAPTAKKAKLVLKPKEKNIKELKK